MAARNDQLAGGVEIAEKNLIGSYGGGTAGPVELFVGVDGDTNAGTTYPADDGVVPVVAAGAGWIPLVAITGDGVAVGAGARRVPVADGPGGGGEPPGPGDDGGGPVRPGLGVGCVPVAGGAGRARDAKPGPLGLGRRL